MFSDPVLWSEDVTGITILQRFSAQYGNDVLPQQSVYKYIEKIKNGCTNVMYDKGARRPSMAITEDNVEHAHDMVQLDK